jgi:DNA-binding HxlR family transcriptional regulator
MFRTHWESKVTTKAAKQIIFILSERLSSLVNAHSVMFAWARRNHPHVTLGWFQKVLGDVFEPEWERLAQWREKKLDERNAKRRKMYQERKGGIKKPRHPNLGERIYLELNREPSTAKVLANTLQVSRKTIESQLLRMCVKGFVSKVGKELYVVPKE